MDKKPKPIIFCKEMIDAIEFGRKTETRRVIIIPPYEDPVRIGTVSWNGDPAFEVRYDPNIDFGRGTKAWTRRIFPKYKQSDILWVREKHRIIDKIYIPSENGYAALYECEGGSNKKWRDLPSKEVFDKITANPQKWISPLFLPQYAARIFLIVTDVRIERIQDITIASCIREGISGIDIMDTYRKLWDNLNKKRGYRWETNPYVFVYGFDRIKVDEILYQPHIWEGIKS